MPMTDAGLSAAIKAQIQAQFGAVPAPPGGNATELQQFCDAVGKAVVDYIQANAQVVVTSVTAVTPGVGTSGPGTGTIL